jgi:hypothetical protein
MMSENETPKVELPTESIKNIAPDTPQGFQVEEYEQTEHQIRGNEARFAGTPGYEPRRVETVKVRKQRLVPKP